MVRPAPGSVRTITLAVLVVAVGLLVEACASRFAFLPVTTIQHLYYLTLPGLDEELFYRGALLATGLPRTLPLPGTRTSWGEVVGVLLFTLGHGLNFPGRLFELGFGADFWRYVQAWWSPTHFPLPTVLFQVGMGGAFSYGCVSARARSRWPRSCIA